jgi:hypothetical protein
MSETYKKLSRPPENALKQIKGGRIKGMTDINPQWRYEAMDEIYGPAGFGWKYEIVKLWTEPGSYDQVMCFAQINLYTNIDGKWSEPIPGLGGSKLVDKDSTGLYTNDEGYKMALTDALSVATKMLGVGADIYRGRWDGSKYRDEPPAPPPSPSAPTKLSAQDEADMNRCLAARKILGYTMDQLKEEKARLKTYAAVADHLEKLVKEQAAVEAAADEGFGTPEEQVKELFGEEVK